MNSESKPIHVAAGVIFNSRGEVLLARRHDHVHQGGLWEFPGGKLEPGEDIEQGLARELHEELGIAVQSARPLIRIRHDYPDKSVLLDVWRVERFSGEPHGREGQPLAWVPVGELGEQDMPAADRPIVHAVRLPSRYLITGAAGDSETFRRRLQRALEQGIRLVQFRAPELHGPERRARIEQALVLCRAHGAEMLVNGDPEEAMELGADGVHLNTRRLMTLQGRPIGRGRWLAASCHNLGELRHAESIGVDFAVLSPVRPTDSHPGAPVLGWEGFRGLVEQVALPVYALGGMQPAHQSMAFAHGAQGIAAIGAWWIR